MINMLFLFLILNVGENIELNTRDTLQEQTSKIQNETFWEKLSFGIGYSGGLCWTSDAMRPQGLMTIPLYWLNSIEVSLSYPLRDDKKIAINLGYGWLRLKDRRGLYLYLPNEDPNIGYAYVETHNWNIRLYNTSFKFFPNNSFYLGGAIYYCIASTEEHLTPHSSNIWTSDTTANVKRKCIGGGVFCGWEGSSMFQTSKLNPFLKLQVGWANEYENDSPWEWEEKLKIHLSGIFVGVKFEIGGTK